MTKTIKLKDLTLEELAHHKQMLLVQLSQAEKLETVFLRGDHARFQRSADRNAKFFLDLGNAVKDDNPRMIRSGFAALVQGDLSQGRAAGIIAKLVQELAQYLYSAGFMDASEIMKTRKAEQLSFNS